MLPSPLVATYGTACPSTQSILLRRKYKKTTGKRLTVHLQIGYTVLFIANFDVYVFKQTNHYHGSSDSSEVKWSKC